MSGGGPGRDWPGSPPGAAFIDTRLQAHHAVQLLTAFAGRLLEPRDDDGHRSFRWVPEQRVLATGSTTRTDRPLSVTFEPATFRLGVVGGSGRDVHRPLAGATLEDARAWLAARVSEALGEAVELAPPEFEIPSHRVATGEPLSPDAHAAAELARWFGAAFRALAPVAEDPAAGPLRCWPHHFDLATLITLPGKDAEGRTRTVGAGVSPGDGRYPHPYGYVTPWPYRWEEERPSLSRGFWNTEGWLGAVLPASDWLPPEGPDRVRSFYAEAVEAGRSLHGAGPGP